MKPVAYWIIIFFQLLSNFHLAYSQNWHSIGPSGKPLSFCLTNEYLLIGTMQSGVLKSTDKGISWRYIENMPPPALGQFTSNSITCITNDPENLNMVYMGFGLDETGGGLGFYKSTDSGDTWQVKNTGLPSWRSARGISINPFNSFDLFSYCRGSNIGIYRSTDQGDSWNLFYTGNDISTNIIFNPTDSSKKYLVLRNGIVNEWTNGTLHQFNSYTSFSYSNSLNTSFVNPFSGSLFYVNEYGIYRWNGLDDWINLTSNVRNDEFVITSCEISQKSGRIFICSNKGVYWSDDDGITWIAGGEWNNMQVGIDGKRIVLIGFEGIYFSRENGNNFGKISDGVKTSSVFSASVVYDNPDPKIYLIGEDDPLSFSNQLFKSYDEGSTWNRVILPMNENPTVVKANPLNSNIVYMGFYNPDNSNYGIYKSYDGGNTWNVVFADSYAWITSIAMIENDTSYILVGTQDKIWKSTNSGENWMSIQSLPSFYGQINSIQISPNKPSLICMGVSANGWTENGFYITTNAGISWQRRINGLSTGLGETNVNSVAISPNDDSTMFIGNGNTIFKSTNQGLLWEETNFPNFYDIGYISDIKFFPDDPEKLLATVDDIIVGEGGLFYSSNCGSSWVEINFPDSSDNSRTFVEILPMDSIYNIYVGTNSFGCYLGKLPRSVSGIEEKQLTDINFQLFQNFPNPYNPSTTIKWNSPIACWQTIKIYDVLGNTIATLVDDYKTAGEHKVYFNADNLKPQLASGIYFYQLKTENFFESRKMLYIK